MKTSNIAAALLLVIWAASTVPAPAGYYAGTVSPANLPWPGGVVPYVFDTSLSAAQQQTYLDGLREWELAANVHFIARTTETQYVFFTYSPTGPNQVSGSNPQTVAINLLTRGQICHEMGHSFGLLHEHQRPDRNTYVNILYQNIIPGNNGDIPGNNSDFDIDTSGHIFGSYDFESVMHYGRDTLSIQPGVLDTIEVQAGFGKYQVRLGNFALSPVDRAMMSSLYGPPTVALSSVVTTTADGGVGSLRAAIYYATDHPGTTITFNIPTSDPGFAAGAFTIKPTGYMPPLVSNGMTIDASTQPGYAGAPLVFLNGANLLPEAGSVPGLFFYEANNTVKGLGIQQFPWVGMALIYPDATGNRVIGCSCGVDSTGNAAAANAFQGIYISSGANGNTIGGTGTNERNVLSGNTQYGLWISGSTTTGNTILGNYIGLNVNGTAALANQLGGVILTDGTNHNTIGGMTTASRNVISGNTSAGIWITGSGVSQNSVLGNLIGLNAAGTAAVANTFVGMYIISGASNNSVLGNVLSGNISEGLRITGTSTSGNSVYGNYAGISPDGSTPIPNGFAGVTMYAGATGNQVGGTSPSQRNILSGNGTVGLAFGDAGTTGNFAYGNYIGTNATGTAAVPNGYAGVYMTGGSTANHLGDGPGTGNLISGNGSVGVLVSDPGTAGNFICNNWIGPDSACGNSFSNQGDGISISNSSQSTQIGGTSIGAANLISGNSARGIAMFSATTFGHMIQRNSISANGAQGIALFTSSNHSQAAPVLSTAVLAIGTTVTGTLSSAANTPFTIEFFSSSGPTPLSGGTFLGQTVITTNGSGSGTINVTLPAIAMAGRSVTATATSQASGDTSEFSNAVTVTSVDSDHDGLPDAYEAITPGLSASNPLDAALDFDGDGFTNLQEFLAGTNPNDPTSRPFATGVLSGGNFLFSMSTVAGRFYRIESSQTLLGAWTPVAINVAGTGGVVQISIPVSPSTPHQFFRATVGE